jgi:phospholipid transport system substrate-binding protein
MEARPMNKLISLITTILLMLYLPIVQAAIGEEPLDLIQGTTENLLAGLEETPGLRNSPDRLHKLVENIVLPHVDLAGLSRLTLGKYWRQATPEQRTRFAEEFRRLLIRTYSSSLIEYKDQSVEYQMLTVSDDRQRSIVRSRIVQPGQPGMQIDYRLRRTGSGWKIYDVTIEGVSLAVSYRTTFSEEIRRNGIEALIDNLAVRNADTHRT